MNNLDKQKYASLFFLLALCFYCYCGSEFKVTKRHPQCYPDNTYVILQWQCRGCGKQVTSDLIEKENDYEGLR